jgi:AcrR family transcriptional regulator
MITEQLVNTQMSCLKCSFQKCPDSFSKFMPAANTSPILPRPRQRLSPQERERQIVSGAIDFFSRRGLDAQIRDLAKEIGIAHTLLYHYFPTKQALIDRVYEELFVGRWNPEWEALLDGPLPLRAKLCRLYQSYLAAILTPEWIRIIVGSGLSDGVIPQRYFEMMRERFFPRVIRETRKALGQRSRAKPSLREHALLMGLHGGLIYSLGIWPHVYGQEVVGQDHPDTLALIIQDRVDAYLSQAVVVVGASNPSGMLTPKPPVKTLRRAA